MVSDGKGRIFERKDGKYLLYLPLGFCEDSMFPFREDLERSKAEHGNASVRVKVSFQPGGVKKLIVSPYVEEES